MADLKEARVPDIGQSGVPVIEVMIKPGDKVEKDQGLVTLESDKATMEVPAPFAGIVKEVKLKVGDEVSEGALIALIEADAGAATEAPKAAAAAAPAPAASAPAPAPAAPAVKEEPVPLGGRSVLPGNAPEGDVPPQSRPPFDARIVMPGDAPYASPAVRAFARELGVDIQQVKGSSRGGRIVRDDVTAYVKHALASGARPVAGANASVGGLSLLPWPKVDFAKFGEIEEKPLTRIQKISGANLARNWAMIPHVTQHEDADITELEAFRKKLGDENKDMKITPLVFQIKAVVAALKKFPQFNASLDEGGEKLILKKYFHIGIAVDTPDGLVVPVLRDCDKKGLLDLATELGEISKKSARQEAGTERNVRRLFLDLLAGRYRRHRVYADRQCAGSGHPWRLQSADQAGMEWQGICAAPDPAAVAQLRPSGDRRCRGRALRVIPRHPARRYPPTVALTGAQSWRTQSKSRFPISAVTTRCR